MKKNGMFKIGAILLVIIAIVLFIVFIQNKENKNTKVEHDIIEVQEGNDVIIKKEEITSQATYYNYIVDGVVIQLFAVKASDGTVRILFNTCGACNPSKMSYFIQVGEYFECQNCKNKYHIDEIGLKNTFGCSPIAVLSNDQEIDGDKIMIKSSFIETYKSKFENINRYEN